jgi:hypothetical protein
MKALVNVDNKEYILIFYKKHILFIKKILTLFRNSWSMVISLFCMNNFFTTANNT